MKNNNGEIVDKGNNNNRLTRVSRASGGKDRHSKVMTSKGVRDRRIRLSVSTAIQFYDLQDRLGYDQPSKAVEWLIKNAEDSISKLPLLNTSNLLTDNQTLSVADAAATVSLSKSVCTSSMSETSKNLLNNLNSGSDTVNINREWRVQSAPMEYFSSGQTHSRPFSVIYDPHQELSSVPNHHEFNMSTSTGLSRFSGSNRGTLQFIPSSTNRNHQSLLANNIQRFQSLEGGQNLFGALPAESHHHNHQFQLYYQNGQGKN